MYNTWYSSNYLTGQAFDLTDFMDVESGSLLHNIQIEADFLMSFYEYQELVTLPPARYPDSCSSWDSSQFNGIIIYSKILNPCYWLLDT